MPTSGQGPAAQGRAFGWDQAAADTVLADVPVPQGERQALGAYQAGRADSDRSGCLLPSLACLGADREPLVGIEAAVSTPGGPDDPGPGSLIAGRGGDQQRAWPPWGPRGGTGSRRGTHSGRAAVHRSPLYHLSAFRLAAHRAR